MHVRKGFPNAITNICVLTLCVATAFCQTSENEMEDHTRSGTYLIVYCNANTTGSHAAYLQILIPFMQSSLRSILRDLDRGTASPAYRAFFKTDNSLDAVREVFTEIVNGPDVLIVGTRNVTHWSPPTLVCADAEEPSLRHLRDSCDNPARPPMIVIRPVKMLAICPVFWTLPHVAWKAACPWVVNGELLTEAGNLGSMQYAVLVHELVHVYNRFDVKEEVYDLVDVVRLNASRSLGNAQNFASYATGELMLLSSAMRILWGDLK